jgi:hypothetical protein
MGYFLTIPGPSQQSPTIPGPSQEFPLITNNSGSFWRSPETVGSKTVIVTSDLKYYPDSGRFYKQKPKREKPTWLKIEEKTSFKKYLGTYSIANKLNIQAYAGIDLMNNFKPQLLNMLSLHNGIKFYFDIQCLMVKYLDGEILTQDTRWVSSRRESIESANNEAELLAKLQSSIDLVKQKIPDLEARNGSMWVFKKVLTLDLHIGRYKPLDI